MGNDGAPAFGKWRSILWPIHRFELKKLLPMAMLFFLTLFNYTILRDAKDAIIVTSSGAETITFLKFWGVLPAAAIFMVIYAKMSNKLSKPALFYATLAPFIVFFGLFAAVLYPLHESLHPTMDFASSWPEGLQGLVAVVKNWTFSLFYIAAELWGSVVLSLLLWGFANDTTKVSESKRFYSLFGMFGNLALLCSGKVIKNIASSMTGGGFQSSLNQLMTLMVISGLLIMGIYWWIQKNVLTDSRFYDASAVKTKKDKPKLSLKESFAFLARSKYIGLIAVLVLSYGVAINLIEVTWKSQLKLQYPTGNEYLAFMGSFSFFTGCATIFTTMFLGGNLLRRLGWKKSAMITPVMLFITGFSFLAFVIFKGQLTGFVSYIGTTPLMIAVMLGAGQNILSKSSKYALFDPTKEMAYIPLDQESKVKGKAAIDVVGARLGKAGGALIQQGLIVVGGSLAVMVPYIAGIVLLIIAGWAFAVKNLAVRFEAAQAKKSEPTPEPAVEEPKAEELQEVTT